MNYKQAMMGFLILLLTGCASISTTPVHLKLTAAKKLNPDIKLSSLPVRLKIYQLSDAVPFQEATFRELWKSDVATLGSSLLDKRELTLAPGEKQLLKMPRHSQAEFIAVVGIFRKHQNLDWKVVKPLPSQVSSWIKPLNIIAGQYKVEIQ